MFASQLRLDLLDLNQQYSSRLATVDPATAKQFRLFVDKWIWGKAFAFRYEPCVLSPEMQRDTYFAGFASGLLHQICPETFTENLSVLYRDTKPDAFAFRRLNLFRFILDKRTRERIFEPAYEDLKQQFAWTRQYNGKWEKRWLSFCFEFRAFVLVLESCRVMLLSAALKPFIRLIPNAISRWWSS